MSFKLQNIETVNFTNTSGTGGVSMIHTSGGVSVDGFVVATGVSAGTLRLTGGSITDTTGDIDFVNENLSTTGTLGCGVLTAASGSTIGNINISNNSISVTSSGNIGFNGDNLESIGTLGCGVLTAASGSTIGDLTLTNGSITDTGGSISFGGNSLSGTGAVEFSGGVSLSGGVSVNGYVYPTSLGTSQFLYYKNDAVGVSGYGLSAGSNITLTYGETEVTIASIGGGGSGVSSLNDLNDAKVVNNSLILGNEGQTATPLSGANNVAVGVSALFSETSGTNNVAIGYNSLEFSQTGNDNIAIGMSTLNLYAGGGGFNTVVGSNSAQGVSSTSVTGLTIIGASSGVTIDTDLSNLTLIGHQVETGNGETSNAVYIGNNAVTDVYIKGNVLVTSDGRDKTDVEDSTYGLNIVDNLRPVEFTWDRRPIVPGDEENTTNGQRSVGLIAQEVRDSLTEEENKILNLVNDSSEERFHMCYNNLIPILVKAVKDLKAEVDTLKQRMDNCSC